MKILQVTTHTNIGGIGNYILSLTRQLVKDGHKVILASGGGGLDNQFVSAGSKLVRLNIVTKFEFAPKVFISAVKLAAIVREEKVDVIHAHTRVSQVASLIASKLTGVPMVTTCHGYFKVRSRKMFDTWGVKVIAISEAVKNHLIEDMGVCEDRVEVIYSGVDIDKYSKECDQAELSRIKDSIGLGKSVVIGTIGRLSDVKGQKFLIQAMALVTRRYENAKCVIVGSGKELANLTSLAKSLGIDGKVIFISSNIDTLPYLSMMDVFVFPSVKEGLGIALLEAMACSRACVASDIGGIKDIITDPSCGLLVPVGDVRAIADSVMALVDNAKLRLSIGESARKIVEEKFSLDRMVKDVINLYKKVISG